MSWFMNLKIRNKLLLGFGLVIAIIIALSVYAMIQTRNTDRTYTYVLDYPIQTQLALFRVRENFRGMRRAIVSVAAWTDSFGDEIHIESDYADALKSYDSVDEAFQDYENIVQANPRFGPQDKSSRLEKAEECRRIIKETLIKQ